jgi:bacillithiol biosynthesis cysteine-adding enzyme BshC
MAGAEPAAQFFNSSPFDLTAYRRKWAEVQHRFDRSAREQAAAALRPTSPRAAERLNRFVETGGAVITTGQQAGLFGGPLYTVYKILTAIRLAETLERELGILVLPVFWIASEDHDWEEVNHTFVVNSADELERIQVSSPDKVPLAMSHRVLGDDIENALDEFAQAIGSKSGASRWLDLLRDAYAPGTAVAKAFRTVIESLFAPLHLLVADAADPALKAASVPVLVGEVTRAQAHEESLREQTAKIVAAGYHAQVAVIPNAANLFVHSSAGRERLHHTNDRWFSRESRLSFSPAEMETLVREEPDRFSPNVFLRPVVESSVFPVLAYVAGPGEISYFAQLRDLFAAFGIAAPIVFPRFSAMLIEAPISRALDSLGLELDVLGTPLHELKSTLARRAVPQAVESALQDLRRMLYDGYTRLIDTVHDVDPTLSGPLGTNRNHSLVAVARSEQEILRRIKAHALQQNEALHRARTHLYPEGNPQERMLNVVPYLARHGTEVLNDIAMQMRFDWVAAGQPGGRDATDAGR